MEWGVVPKAVKRCHLFEVKSICPSMGELVRQIRLYEQYENGTFWVVSPDDRWGESPGISGDQVSEGSARRVSILTPRARRGMGGGAMREGKHADTVT